MPIRDDVLALPVSQRADAKSVEYARIVAPGAEARPFVGDIEIQRVTAIAGGVEVLVRAWDRQGRPIAFGDGTVEIERMRFFNPPILVPDPAGDIDLSSARVDPATGDLVLMPRLMREDLREALLQSIEDTLAVLPRPVARIVRGKVGRTTSTFYAGPGDGWINVQDLVWATARSASTGTADYTSTFVEVGSMFFAPNSQIRRAFYPFDTSAIPNADRVTAATFSLYYAAGTRSNGDNDGDDWIVPVGPTTQASDTSLVGADYDTCAALDSPSELSADRKDITGITLDAYSNWALNAAGLAAISLTGYTRIGLREGHDIIDSPVIGSNGMGSYGSEQSGTSQDPKLVVSHAGTESIIVNRLRPRIFAPGRGR